MEPSAESEAPVRVLGLGNEVLADDALGILVAGEIRRIFAGRLEVVCSSAAGVHLLDDLLGARRLLVVDTIQTGTAKPGTIQVLSDDQIRTVAGSSPHFIGLFEMIALGRELELAVPREVVIIAVEASDCSTLGGGMHPDVRAAIPRVTEFVRQFMAKESRYE